MKRRVSFSAGNVLIASDSASDAALIKRLLGDEFAIVNTSIDPALVVEDFERYLPQVLILAFNRIENSEQYCLALFRAGSSKVHLQQHRSILLCDKDELQRAYRLCQRKLFDDYNLFWPMTQDPQRLPMSVHMALRELNAAGAVGPEAAELAAAARRLAELEVLLEQQLALGRQRISDAGSLASRAGQDIGAALERFSTHFSQGELPGAGADGLDHLRRELARLTREELMPSLGTVEQAVAGLAGWNDGLRQELQPHIDTARTLQQWLPATPLPVILVVDDDEIERRLIGAILKDEHYRLIYVASALEALIVLRTVRPDLILMDVLMPDMDGMTATRQIKAVPQFAGVPVIMITGNSETSVVMDSYNSGATDFVVKPFDREKLIARVASGLRHGKAARLAVPA
jgi:CheY-like chemotaxis protein